MFPFLYHLLQPLQPILVPVCFISAWIFLLLLVWSLVSSIQDATERTKQMHKIPCTDCQFFTGNYHLKCTVHPAIANTESAINCHDYSPKVNPLTTPQNSS